MLRRAYLIINTVELLPQYPCIYYAEQSKPFIPKMSPIFDLRFLIKCFIFVVCVCNGPAPYASRDFDTIKSRLWGSKIPTDGQDAYKRVSSILELMSSNGAFEDIDYGNSLSTGSKPFTDHCKRLNILGQSYHINETENEWYHSPALKDRIQLGYDYITYSAPTNEDTNWYGHQIGLPLRMYTGLVLMERELPRSLVTDTLRRYWVETQVWDVEDTRGTNGGSNFAYRAYLSEYLSGGLTTA